MVGRGARIVAAFTLLVLAGCSSSGSKRSGATTITESSRAP